MTPAIGAAAAARNLCFNGVTGCGLALAVIMLAPVTVVPCGFAGARAWFLLLAVCLGAIAFSLHLLFDAALFRLAASHRDETVGLEAVDDLLARLGLRKRETGCRPLASRIAGSRRIVWRQRVMLGVCLLLFVILLIDASDGPC